MNFTIEQKERITELFSLIYMKIGRQRKLTESIKKGLHLHDDNGWEKYDYINPLVFQDLGEIAGILESYEHYVDKLKQYLMEIDER